MTQFEYKVLIGSDQSGPTFDDWQPARARWEEEVEHQSERPAHIKSQVRLFGRKVTDWVQVA
jgi:hypothetical protein